MLIIEKIERNVDDTQLCVSARKSSDNNHIIDSKFPNNKANVVGACHAN